MNKKTSEDERFYERGGRFGVVCGGREWEADIMQWAYASGLLDGILGLWGRGPMPRYVKAKYEHQGRLFEFVLWHLHASAWELAVDNPSWRPEQRRQLRAAIIVAAHATHGVRVLGWDRGNVGGGMEWWGRLVLDWHGRGLT